jgi:lysyl-tRNA synthetase class 2
VTQTGSRTGSRPHPVSGVPILDRSPLLPEPSWQGRIPQWSKWFLWTIAAICAVSAVTAAVVERVQPIRHLIDLAVFPAPANLAYAAFCLLLGSSLVRRKQIAWRFLVFLLVLQAIGSVIGLVLLAYRSRTDPSTLRQLMSREPFGQGEWALVAAGVVIGALLLTVAIVTRHEFYAPVRRGSFWKALLTLGIGIAAGMGVGLLILSLIRRHMPWTSRVELVSEHVFGGAVNFGMGDRDRLPPWLRLLLGAMGALALVAAMYVLFRSQRSRARLEVDDEVDLRLLLAAFGSGDSLGYFATRRDKNVVFAADRRAAVTYRVENGVCLASSDPVGDPRAWDAAVTAWQEFAQRYAWTPAVLGASVRGAEVYGAHGLKVLELGDEAILTARGFDLDLPELKPVRQATQRLLRAGYSLRVRRHADVPVGDMADAVLMANLWRVGTDERGFSMALSRLGDPADGDCVLVEALDDTGTVRGLLSFVPWGSDGLSLDLMRRDPAAPNGVTEFMISGLMTQLGGLGLRRISLNFAVFRSAFAEGARIGAGPIARAWRSALLVASKWWQIESLYRSNVKYAPAWQPRFLCFRETGDLAWVALAAGRAEGFVRGFGERPVASLSAQNGTGVAVAARVDAAEPLEPCPDPADTTAGVSEQTRVRIAKLARLSAAGVDAYPVRVPRSHRIADVLAAHDGLGPDARTGEVVSVAGRVMASRRHAVGTFLDLVDWSGRLQVFVTDPTVVGQVAASIDLGDWISASGEVMATHTGQLSVQASSVVLAAACLHPLPDKRKGLTDPELRVRHRSLDLIVNPAARDQLRARSVALAAVRTELMARDFLEVETPILQRVHGGANARPFVTHINAYDMQLYLRIAPELFLKRLCVGGVERVFEMGRDFRNEGADVKHNPEFSMLEAYQAFADYRDMLELTQTLIRQACLAVHGSMILTRGEIRVDLEPDWPVVTVDAALSAALRTPVSADTSVAELRQHADEVGIPLRPDWSRGDVVLELYEHLVEATTVVPTFYCDFPADVSPLTRAHRDDDRLAERWDLVAFGVEIGTAYSELIDPQEQRRRLTAQSLRAAAGDPEAMELDEDFLHALEFAMPPTGGLGIGLDRLVMLLTGAGIRDTIAFPLVRPGSGGR